MFETKPRRIASSAISRWLQWLIGRSLSDGFSQVSRSPRESARGCMSRVRPSAAHSRAAPTRIERQAPAEEGGHTCVKNEVHLSGCDSDY
jgi:hypothetical protein